MRRNHRSESQRRDHSGRRASYNGFMTQKEKDFVASFFERNNKRKERTFPDFYTQERVPQPEHRRKEAEEDSLFEGVLGMAIRRSHKSLTLTSDKTDSAGVFIKKLISRGKIEEIYDILNEGEIFTSEAPEAPSTAPVLEKIKEIGEDLFNMEKGLALVDRLLFHAGTSNREYTRAVLSVLVSRVRYIYYTPELGECISKLVPVLKEESDILKISPAFLGEASVANTAGVFIGHIALLIFKKDSPDLFRSVCSHIAKALTDTAISRLFQKTPASMVWRLLSVASRKMEQPELAALKKRLSVQIAAGLNSRSPTLIENIRAFTKRCP
ncbi:uncharacterized protein NEMAJ01_1075 [Nematocida major]|uniref:uncharacterized protein n=1 Tax=Nematocida major TaxID=1912982 RepID=UPI002008DEDF|nr:uncharacterized protein NEMAJ01_1075 [Nematocida major]KAH9386179.1 hypothetical protein NEMAJ01_1075 [Nematocida major]